MRIYTKAGDLAFSTFTFPDGQPHFKLETYDREFDEVTIEMAFTSTDDVLLCAMAADVLRNGGYSSISLNVRYLLSARMDRAISVGEPFTLHLVARILNSCGFNRVRLLDVHSEVATRLIRNSVNFLPHAAVCQVLTTVQPDVVIAPDKGAVERVDALINGDFDIVNCSKDRDVNTGHITGIFVNDFTRIMDKSCLILDDICDGGATFIMLAQKLRTLGASSISLFVTHGVFSKGVLGMLKDKDGGPLIDRVFTTDSYYTNAIRQFSGVTCIPIKMDTLR